MQSPDSLAGLGNSPMIKQRKTRIQNSQQPCLDVKPVQPGRSQGLGLRELEHAAAKIGAEVVQVRVHGVGAAPEVQVVGKVYHLVQVRLRDLIRVKLTNIFFV